MRHVLGVRFAANKKIEEHDFDSYASSSCLTLFIILFAILFEVTSIVASIILRSSREFLISSVSFNLFKDLFMDFRTSSKRSIRTFSSNALSLRLSNSGCADFFGWGNCGWLGRRLGLLSSLPFFYDDRKFSYKPDMS